jgi:glycosyltransferase involved in cell wall biosynthesis
MRILLVTDAWLPQVNGVVRTLQTTCAALQKAGHQVERISPETFRTIACPSYPEIRLALLAGRAVARRIEAYRPDAIHIATEGPLGLAARRWCVRHGAPFTTAYHTQFPDYLAKRTGLPSSPFWPFIRWFHGPAQRTMVSTASIAGQLETNGIRPTHRWGRGVELDLFHPDVDPHRAMARLPRPIQLYVGRVAVEKNIEAFLAGTHPGSKVVVGDGPAREALQRRYPQAHFLGALKGNTLAAAYATADVLVFPSRTDTFGLVIIEALACGTPVAAYPVPGPIDVLSEEAGAMREDLDEAITAALTRDRTHCRAYAEGFNWEASTAQFLAGLVPAIEWKTDNAAADSLIAGALQH